MTSVLPLHSEQEPSKLTLYASISECVFVGECNMQLELLRRFIILWLQPYFARAALSAKLGKPSITQVSSRVLQSS